jgi:hypothetical protein
MQVQLGRCLIRWKWLLEPLNGKILCRIYGPVHDNAQCGIHYTNESCGLYKGIYVVTHVVTHDIWSVMEWWWWLWAAAAVFMCSVKWPSRCVVFL